MRTLLEEILEGLDLTSRELCALDMAAEGLTAAETAQRMHLAVETVKGYRKRMIAKLGAKNTANAVAIALRKGLIV